MKTVTTYKPDFINTLGAISNHLFLKQNKACTPIWKYPILWKTLLKLYIHKPKYNKMTSDEMKTILPIISTFTSWVLIKYDIQN